MRSLPFPSSHFAPEADKRAAHLRTSKAISSGLPFGDWQRVSWFFPLVGSSRFVSPAICADRYGLRKPPNFPPSAGTRHSITKPIDPCCQGKAAGVIGRPRQSDEGPRERIGFDRSRIIVRVFFKPLQSVSGRVHVKCRRSVGGCAQGQPQLLWNLQRSLLLYWRGVCAQFLGFGRNPRAHRQKSQKHDLALNSHCTLRRSNLSEPSEGRFDWRGSLEEKGFLPREGTTIASHAACMPILELTRSLLTNNCVFLSAGAAQSLTEQHEA